MFGMIQTHPLYVYAPGGYDEFGYPKELENIREFEGVIDYVSGNRHNDYMSIHPDTTHVIITEFSEKLYHLFTGKKSLIIEDGAGNTYDILLVDNPGLQSHHLEIEVETTLRQSKTDREEAIEEDAFEEELSKYDEQKEFMGW